MYKIVNKKKLIATIIADAVGKTIFAPVNLTKKKEVIALEKVREILIIRTAYVGDVVMTSPILKPLKERFPGSSITFLTSTGAKELLINNPYVDEIVTYNPFWFYPTKIGRYLEFISQLKKRSFDLVIEARGDIRDILFLVWPAKAKYKVSYGVGGGAYLLTHVVPYSGLKHKVEYHLDLVRYLGCKTEGHEWAIYLMEEEKEAVKDILKEHQISKPFFCAHPGARLFLKRWPVEMCARLYDKILEEFDAPLVILGSKDEKELVNEIVDRMENQPIVLAGKLNLRRLSGVLAEASLFVCNDSGPMHIAAAMKTPTVAIFGPSKSRETGPYGKKCRVVEKDFPCRLSCDESVCKNKVYQACMNAISPDDVYRSVMELAKGGQADQFG